MTARVAIVGASARAAAFSVIRSGRKAVAADLFGDADLQQACPVTPVSPYPEGLLDWLRETSCDGWLYTGALENFPELVDQLAMVRPLLGNPGNVLRRVRNPLLLAEVLTRHELPFPETRKSSVGLPSDGSWLAKTCQGSSGSGVEPFTAGIGNDKFFQRFIQGTACSAVFAGPRLLGITRQLVGEVWAGAGRFQYCGSVAPWPLPTAAEKQLRLLGEVLVDEFDLVGLYGVDFAFDGQRPWAIEVNPRYTAAVEVVERARHINAIDWHLDHGGDLPLPENSLACQGKTILFAKQETMILDEFTQWALTQPDLADIPQPGDSDLGRPTCANCFCHSGIERKIIGSAEETNSEAPRGFVLAAARR